MKKYIITEEQLRGLEIALSGDKWSTKLCNLEEYKEQKITAVVTKDDLMRAMAKPSKKSLLERQTEATEKIAEYLEDMIRVRETVDSRGGDGYEYVAKTYPNKGTEQYRQFLDTK